METISIRNIYDELKKIEKNMVTKKEMEALRETVEIMGNPETMKQIVDSVNDIQKGNVKEVDSVQDMINE